MTLLFGEWSNDPINDSSCDVVVENIETEEEVYKIMREKISEMKFKSYYYRSMNIEPDITLIDYGSHSTFFYIVRR